MKTNKTQKIEIRLTPEEKELIKEYAKKHEITISEAVRSFCYKMFIKERD